MPNTHAVLSASGAHRWLNCTPSALLEADRPDSSSAAAEQGSAAHALAEHKLLSLLGRSAGSLPSSELIDEEMDEHTDDYASFVMERLAQAREVCGDPFVLVEERLDFSHVVPGGFGTGDCVIIAEPVLEIIDFKYGLGVLVEAEGNAQMRLYALGALHAYGHLYGIERVRMTIFQPRRSNISTAEMSVEELEAWASEYVKPRAELAITGSGEFQAGSWCQFCKIAPTCRARAEKNQALAALEFKSPAELNDAEIAQVLSAIPELTSWASDVQTYALTAAINQGKQWAGFKLVEGRSVRKYTSEEAVTQTLNNAGVTGFTKTSLLGITDMTKLLGKKKFTELLGDLVVKPQGKPQLVPVTDKRPALTFADATQEFKNTTKE